MGGSEVAKQRFLKMRGRFGVLLTHYIPRLSNYPLFGPEYPLLVALSPQFEGARRVLVDILPAKSCGNVTFFFRKGDSNIDRHTL